jgi:hypothetical protein
MPASRPSPSTVAVVASRAQDILRAARTLHMACRARHFTPDSLEKAWAAQKGFAGLGLRIVKETRVAHLLVTVDRPLLTDTFTYLVTDQRTSILLDSRKVAAIDGGGEGLHRDTRDADIQGNVCATRRTASAPVYLGIFGA